MREGNLADIAIGLPLETGYYGELSPYAGGEMSPYGSSEMESGLLGLTGKFNVFRQSYCKRVCKSLGYEKRAKLGGDKAAFTKCKNQCLINFAGVKSGKYKIPAVEGGSLDLAAIDKETASETGVSVSAADAAKMPAPSQEELAENAGGNNMMMYIIIGVVVLLLIIGAVLMMRKKQAAA